MDPHLPCAVLALGASQKLNSVASRSNAIHVRARACRDNNSLFRCIDSSIPEGYPFGPRRALPLKNLFAHKSGNKTGHNDQHEYATLIMTPRVFLCPSVSRARRLVFACVAIILQVKSLTPLAGCPGHPAATACRRRATE